MTSAIITLSACPTNGRLLAKRKWTDALENLRQMYATTETVEREIQIGDYVLLDVESETTELNRKGFAILRPQ